MVLRRLTRRQVLRWGALVLGLGYGFTHQAALSRQAEAHKVEQQYKTREELITKAKAAYAQSKLPASQKSGDGKSESPCDPNCMDYRTY